MTIAELDPEDKQKRINRIMEHTKEEIATQWVTLGSDMKQKYDKLKISDQRNPMKYLEVRLEML
jgi:cell fate regulator YaaT (PSP1 superfamily)